MTRRPTPASYPAPAQLSRPPPLPRRVQLSLPYPPSTNEWLRPGLINGHPRLLITAKAKAYKEGVGRLLAGRTPLVGPVAITKLHAFPPSNSYDLDNVFKVLLDALTGRAWLDDRQVKRITNVEMFLFDGNPRVDIVIEQIFSAGDQLSLGTE